MKKSKKLFSFVLVMTLLLCCTAVAPVSCTASESVTGVQVLPYMDFSDGTVLTSLTDGGLWVSAAQAKVTNGALSITPSNYPTGTAFAFKNLNSYYADNYDLSAGKDFPTAVKEFRSYRHVFKTRLTLTQNSDAEDAHMRIGGAYSQNNPSWDSNNPRATYAVMKKGTQEGTYQLMLNTTACADPTMSKTDEYTVPDGYDSIPLGQKVSLAIVFYSNTQKTGDFMHFYVDGKYVGTSNPYDDDSYRIAHSTMLRFRGTNGTGDTTPLTAEFDDMAYTAIPANETPQWEITGVSRVSGGLRVNFAGDVYDSILGAVTVDGTAVSAENTEICEDQSSVLLKNIAADSCTIGLNAGVSNILGAVSSGTESYLYNETWTKIIEDEFDGTSSVPWNICEGKAENGILLLAAGGEIGSIAKQTLEWDSAGCKELSILENWTNSTLRLHTKVTLMEGTSGSYGEIGLCNSGGSVRDSLIRLEQNNTQGFDVKINLSRTGNKAPEVTVLEQVPLGYWVDIKLLIFGNTVMYYIDGNPAEGSFIASNRPSSSRGIYFSAAENSSGSCVFAVENVMMSYKKGISVPKTVQAPEKDNFDIFLFIGQSNMAGRASLTQYDATPIENAYLLNSENNWEIAQCGVVNGELQGLNRYSTIEVTTQYNGTNMAGEFARFYTKVHPDRKLGIVCNAKGNTGIPAWQKGAEEGYYSEAVNRVKEAMKYGILRGIIWHQGENNAGAPNSYMEYLKQMVSDLRSDLEMPAVPFIIGELCTAEGVVNQSLHETFNSTLKNRAEAEIANCAVFSAEQSNYIEDAIHMDASGQRLLGVRCAQEAEKLITGEYAPICYIYELQSMEKMYGDTPRIFISASAVNMTGQMAECYLATYTESSAHEKSLLGISRVSLPYKDSLGKSEIILENVECPGSEAKLLCWNEHLSPLSKAVVISNTDADWLYRRYFCE